MRRCARSWLPSPASSSSTRCAARAPAPCFRSLRIDGSWRPAIRDALLEASAPRLPPEAHLSAQAHARNLLTRGVIGVRTFRSAIRRNPLLRAQNQLEREQSRASQLDLASRHKSEFLAN